MRGVPTMSMVDALVERDGELRQLSTTAAAVAQGRAQVVVVSGEAGIGKTTLWSAFLGTLPPGWRIITAAADLTDRSLAAPFAHLVAGTTTDASDPAQSLARALAEALSKDLDDGSVVLVVDDLQFLDPVAIRALRLLAVQLATAPLLLLATYRLGAHPPTSSAARAVAELAGAPWATELRLVPLSLAGTADLLAHATGARDDDRARTLHERTAGNPFFLTQLLRTPTDELPWTVDEAVTERLEALSESANELAMLLAVAGGPIAAEVVDALPVELRDSARRLVDSGLATVDSAGLRVRHGLVAESIRAALDDQARRRAHAALAAAMTAAPGTPPELLARHLLAAGQDDEARRYAAEGADRLMTGGDVSSALELYELALETAPPQDPATTWLRRRATAAAVAAGAGSRVRPTSAPSTEGWEAATLEPEQRRDLRQGSAQVTAAVADAHRAIADGRYEEAASVVRPAIAAARASHDATAAVEACLALLYAGEHAEADATLADLAAAATAEGRHGDAAVAHSARARVALAQGDFDRATKAQRLATASARATGQELLVAGALVTAAVFEATSGHLGAAERLTAEAEAIGDFVAQLAGKMPRAMVALEGDDIDGARALIGELAPVVRAIDLPHYRWPVLLAGALIEREAGDTVRTTAWLDEAEPLLFSPFQENQADFLGLRGEVAFEESDRSGVERSSHSIGELARSVPGPHILASADHMAGRLASLDGDHETAAHQAEAAADMWERAARFISAASAWTDAAREHIRAGTNPSAAIERAHALITEHGLHLRARRLEAVRREAVDQRPDVLGMLSPRERDVVLLAAERRTNREIADALYLSEKTVRNYLSAAFTKLSISRRGELRDLLSG